MVGGMMRFGIPKYRLPRDVLDAEAQRILDMGVTLELNRKVTNLLESMREGGSTPPSSRSAPTSASAPTSRPARPPRILDAVSVLREHGGRGAAVLGRRVVVYGGGNTAMDVARTAKRLGATEAIVVYRRTRERMPAHEFEVEEAEEEGVMMRWLSTIKQADGGTVLEKMELDSRASRSPPASSRSSRRTRSCWRSARRLTSRCSTGSPGIEVEDGVVKVGPNLMTGHAGIFAGGDMVPAERTVTVGDRARQEGRRQHRRLAARRGV